MATHDLRVAIYARVSGEQQAKEDTIASQLEAVAQRITSDALECDPELQFVDDGYSGSVGVHGPGGETQSIFKAPQPGKAQKQLTEGYHPEDFSSPGGDNRAYFAKDRGLADEYAQHYGEGVLEVEVPKDVYDARLRKHETPYQGGPRIELPIPHEDFDVLNRSTRKLHE
jgi:hypothetical protein